MLKTAAVAIAFVSGCLAPVLADGTPMFKLTPIIVASVVGYNGSEPAIQHKKVEARILSIDSVEIPAPENFYERGDHATIAIHLNADGLVSGASLYKTCGYYRIDQNALKAVRDAKYQAATVDGRAVSSDYLVDVDLEN